MTTLDDFSRVAAADRGLCVVVTTRGDGTAQASVVNAGVLAHPRTGEPAVGLVVMGRSRKLANLRARPRATLVVKQGWEWVALEGAADILGPDDPQPGIDADGLRIVLREVFTAAGGTHDNFDEYDAVMARERRAAVFVTPARVYSNG